MITRTTGTGDNQTAQTQNPSAALVGTANVSSERVGGSGDAFSSGTRYRGLFNDPQRSQLHSSSNMTVMQTVQQNAKQSSNNSHGLFG
ncbi:hypothetical protein [Lacticaseibacillus hulanensis]|uniref:hypothetical protein n=1 Tax=Lacticaseibacillus hulanensis TaxID=2493111 RepID=UPI000FDAFCE6|nr:hypothetical protein [Lacticaseibacillus hulanensis]